MLRRAPTGPRGRCVHVAAANQQRDENMNINMNMNMHPHLSMPDTNMRTSMFVAFCMCACVCLVPIACSTCTTFAPNAVALLRVRPSIVSSSLSFRLYPSCSSCSADVASRRRVVSSDYMMCISMTHHLTLMSNIHARRAQQHVHPATNMMTCHILRRMLPIPLPSPSPHASSHSSPPPHVVVLR